MLLQLIFSIICLGLGSSVGFAAGLWKVGFWNLPDVDPEADEPPLPLTPEERTQVEENAEHSLRELQAIAARVTDHVAQHNERVEGVQRELASAGTGGVDPSVAAAAEALRRANEKLQAELAAARQELERKREEINSHRREARTDGLTRLMNRRAFDEEMQTVAERSRSGEHASVMLLDVDHFKKFNDTYGHQVGDRVLQHVADVMRNTLLGLDVAAARYGGEEFAVIAWGGGLPIAMRLAEELRQAIENTSIKHEGKDLGVRISLGLSQMQSGLTIAELLERSDQALYAAKENGRNRCYYHDGDKCIGIVELLAAAAAHSESEVEANAEAVQTPSPRDASATANDANKQLAVPAATSSNAKKGKERRRHPRLRYVRWHRIAPFVAGRAPTADMFEEVQFFDISSSGFAMLLPSIPRFRFLIVALEKNNETILVSAQVVRTTQSDVRDETTGKPYFLVGCRFTGKLRSTPNAPHELLKESSI